MLGQAGQLAIFDRTPIAHEPKSAPGAGLSFALWWTRLAPLPPRSGLAAGSGGVTFGGRVYKSFLAKPEDEIHPHPIDAPCALPAPCARGVPPPARPAVL